MTADGFGDLRSESLGVFEPTKITPRLQPFLRTGGREARRFGAPWISLRDRKTIMQPSRREYDVEASAFGLSEGSSVFDHATDMAQVVSGVSIELRNRLKRTEGEGFERVKAATHAPNVTGF